MTYNNMATTQNFTSSRVTYPSPFFDLSSTYLPSSVRDLFRWCEYYFLTNPLVNTVVNKLAEYPVTDIIIEHDDRKVREKWESYLKGPIALRSECISIGMDYYTFGACYLSVLFPFVKEIQCPSCEVWFASNRIKNSWKFTNHKFSIKCPKCGSRGGARVRDTYYKNVNKVRLVRWNPKQIDISYNEITGKPIYYYKPSRTLINDLNLGLKDIVCNTPQVIIEAIKRPENRLRLEESNFYHIKRPSLSSRDTGYGVPILLPVLKDLFYLQTLKRAQEAIAAEHIVPRRIIFPQAPSASADPISTLNLQNWRREVKAELANWKKDPNYTPVLGFPMGQEQLGGDARALLLAQEIQLWSDMIVAGMGVPREIVFGGASWSGSNVSLRLLENKFLNYITQLEHMMDFVIRKLATYTGWPRATARFRPFKMADDMQRKMGLQGLNQAGKISDSTLLEDWDLDSETQDKLMRKEAERRTQTLKEQKKAEAEMMGEAMIVQAKYQQRAQEMGLMPQPEQPGAEGPPPELPAGAASQLQPGTQQPTDPTNMTLNEAADHIVKQIQGMEPADSTKYMAQLKAKLPDLASVVGGLLEQQAIASQMPPGQQEGQMKPLPEQKPPRREGSPI